MINYTHSALKAKQSKVKIGEGRSLYAHQIFK